MPNGGFEADFSLKTFRECLQVVCSLERLRHDAQDSMMQIVGDGRASWNVPINLGGNYPMKACFKKSLQKARPLRPLGEYPQPKSTGFTRGFGNLIG